MDDKRRTKRPVDVITVTIAALATGVLVLVLWSLGLWP